MLDKINKVACELDNFHANPSPPCRIHIHMCSDSVEFDLFFMSIAIIVTINCETANKFVCES